MQFQITPEAMALARKKGGTIAVDFIPPVS